MNKPVKIFLFVLEDLVDFLNSFNFSRILLRFCKYSKKIQGYNPKTIISLITRKVLECGMAIFNKNIFKIRNDLINFQIFKAN